MKHYIHGTGNKTALLIHGMASYSGSWGELVTDLNSLSYEVITIDLPGHGAAVKDIASYKIETWESQLIQLVPHADLIVGHSIGGLLGLKIRKKLQSSKTVAIDPLLRFPTGLFQRMTQEAFGISQMAIGLRANDLQKEALSFWDKSAVRALSRARGIPMLDENVMIIRPRGSYVAPLSILKKADKAKILTFEKAGHNLHRDAYPRFFEALKDFIHGDTPQDVDLTQAFAV